ncbi:MAG: DUF1684 domain-containing protein [Gemmatimonadetes bacterium]|jgi:uncharacterized protein|nr:DUF1684 domain-containing protein [Gemmatimonadota bacterium]MBT6149827.1 DUF1684 domain-containing protein [Gemmatimonadota bacterium]MBT7860571.1 DUF1684 domain-containing protein [Gemmatimonadota bacterium]
MMQRFRHHLVLTVLPAVLLAGEGWTQPSSDTTPALRHDSDATSAWVAEHENTRARKDAMFLDADQSPLLPEDRGAFSGLVYYDLDERFRIHGQLHRYARMRQVSIPDTKGTQMFVERIGRFHFQWDGKPFWLEVMGSTRDNDLSVYFTDQTNGITTYPAGRYAPVRQTEDGSYLIDFNNAYSPYCAYNPEYICPLPPAQNRLSFHIEAGEVISGPDLAH